MEIAPSTQMAQSDLMNQVGTAVLRKGLDQQKQDGQNVIALLNSAVSPALSDPALGNVVNVKA